MGRNTEGMKRGGQANPLPKWRKEVIRLRPHSSEKFKTPTYDGNYAFASKARINGERVADDSPEPNSVRFRSGPVEVTSRTQRKTAPVRFFASNAGTKPVKVKIKYRAYDPRLDSRNNF